MKKLLSICFLLCGYVSFSQIQAITNNGDSVILNKDGTWAYINEIQNSSSDLGNWNIKYYVDDFGDPTNSGYVTNDGFLVGKFSNSASTNAELKAYFIVRDSANIAIKLFEYGSSVVKAYSTDTYDIKVKDSNGEIFSMSGSIYEGGDRLHIDPSYKKKHISKMHQILLKGGSITLVIKSTNHSLSTYKISFDADGYKNAYNQLYQ